MLNKTPKWAIWATGRIAHELAKAIQFVDKSQLIAVGSRTQENADIFAKEYKIPKAYQGLKALLADDEIDIVYIATPHMFHYDEAKQVLNAGKHVLCEKAFTVNAKQAQELIELAQQKNLLIMEAMWARFLPLHQHIKKILEQGIIGQINYAKFDFLIDRDFNAEHRLFKKSLAGGALLDLGIYCLSVAQFYMGDYDKLLHTHAIFNSEQTDQIGYVGVSFPNGAIADLHFGISLPDLRHMILYGEKGYLTIPDTFHVATECVLKLHGMPEQIIKMPYIENGYPHEIKAFNELVQAGKLESDQMPLQQTLTLMKQMDEIRKVWNLTYQGD